ncbi:SAM-dependent methyltransferase [Sulfitobacter sabulilitoris]|uniref:SAM-dependent methyltransferase n=1 Tax=Sulfitobacter sabulilitoris TaxID=2562655 RepID=A0A5S3PH41_9RHOB|nr:SAM-dependent methyltransferase [Sulfitobacter sabulilitoris]TMM52631.1 SAM-dependent methyltransferase [Sulfitobacter sabulilitoris]
MTLPIPLTDRAALNRNRMRAADGDLFLQSAAADDVQDRLTMVNRTFKSPAVVTPFPAIWADRIPGARIVADDETLDLAPGAHDLVVHALGLHWANDPVGQLIQCRRALSADGLLIAVALGGQTLHELRSCLGQAEAALTGGLSPRVAPMGEVRDLGALLQRAGLALPVADSLPLQVEYRSMWHLMRDLRAMGEANAQSARPRNVTRRALFHHAAELYAGHFAAAEERITATFELITLTGWAPDESQPQPLRPGSARQRLADALATQENPLPD